MMQIIVYENSFYILMPDSLVRNDVCLNLAFISTVLIHLSGDFGQDFSVNVSG